MLIQLRNDLWIDPSDIKALHARGNPECPDGFPPQLVIQLSSTSFVLTFASFKDALITLDAISTAANQKPQRTP